MFSAQDPGKGGDSDRCQELSLERLAGWGWGRMGRDGGWEDGWKGGEG